MVVKIRHEGKCIPRRFTAYAGGIHLAFRESGERATPCSAQGWQSAEATFNRVPIGPLFVLGDNRDVLRTRATFGVLPIADVTALASRLVLGERRE